LQPRSKLYIHAGANEKKTTIDTSANKLTTRGTRRTRRRSRKRKIIMSGCVKGGVRGA
jgi:hypothetical protein